MCLCAFRMSSSFSSPFCYDLLLLDIIAVRCLFTGSLPLMSLKFEIPAVASGLRAAAERILSVCNVAASSINKDGARFAVTDETGACFLGVKPMLAVVAKDPAQATLFGGSAAERAAIGQWVSTALQLNIKALDLADVEPMVTKTGFLAGTSTASAGDLFFYCVAAPQALSNAKAYPNVASWIKNAEKTDLIKPVIVSRDAVASTAKAEEADAGEGKGQRKPNAEEIEAKRKEKEAAKAAKAAKAAAEGKPEAAPAAAATAAADDGKGEKKKTQKKAVNPADLDLRIGKMVSVERHPESDKLLVEKIELGDPEGPRQILSGLASFYAPEQIVGKHVLVLCNMKPRSLAGMTSSGMVLCASKDEALQLVEADGVPPGTRVVVGTTVVPPELPAIPSAKQLEELVKHFTSDDKGVVHWQDQALLINGQKPVIAAIPNAIVK